jgi:hypothetical protein
MRPQHPYRIFPDSDQPPREQYTIAVAWYRVRSVGWIGFTSLVDYANLHHKEHTCLTSLEAANLASDTQHELQGEYPHP